MLQTHILTRTLARTKIWRKKRHMQEIRWWPTDQPTHDKISTMPLFSGCNISITLCVTNYSIYILCVFGIRFYQCIYLFLFVCRFVCTTFVLFMYVLGVTVKDNRLRPTTEQKSQRNKHKCQKLLFCEHKQFLLLLLFSTHFISYPYCLWIKVSYSMTYCMDDCGWLLFFPWQWQK